MDAKCETATTLTLYSGPKPTPLNLITGSKTQVILFIISYHVFCANGFLLFGCW
uniref:Uncharacterized protein n=1 Tax=Rhizophora mucronata TaxID=61149 RepID=A0A2P2IMZ5_RHIMU